MAARARLACPVTQNGWSPIDARLRLGRSSVNTDGFFLQNTSRYGPSTAIPGVRSRGVKEGREGTAAVASRSARRATSSPSRAGV